MTHVLIVDDDREVLATLTDALLMIGYTVTTAENGREAHHFFRKSTFDLAIVDVDMPVMNGLDLTREIKKIRRDFPVILITGFSHLYKPLEVLNLDVEAFLQKPIHIPRLIRIIEEINNRNRQSSHDIAL